MNDNYKHTRQFTDKLLQEYYQSVEKDLEKIINAPSLLARTSKYYHLSSDPVNDVFMLVFVYDGQIWIVKEWDINKFQDYILMKQKVELWCESNLSIIHSDPIMYQGGLR